MRANFFRQWTFVFLLLLMPTVAEAYIGPGAGISFLQGLWVAVVGVVLSLLAILFLPVRLLIRSIGRARALLVLAVAAALAWFVFSDSSDAPGGVVDSRVLVLGFDGLDPVLAQRWMTAGRMPNFVRLAERGSFQTLGTTIPAQSPVAWSSFATGTNPGEHGIFDFLRRSTDSYEPEFSISETTPSQYSIDLFGLSLPTDGGVVINRRIGEPFWVSAEKNSAKATVLRVPVSYPPDPVHRMLSGMGVPDLLGSQGTYSVFTTERLTGNANARVQRVRPDQKGRVELQLNGPDNPLVPGEALSQRIVLEPAPRGVSVKVNDLDFLLLQHQWSDWVSVEFDIAGPINVKGMVRFLLLQSYPQLKLYVSPIHVDPYDTQTPISSPQSYAAELADRLGLYHTIGMPEETWSLNDGQISDADFLAMVGTTFAEREAMWLSALDARDSELVTAVFVQTDRVSHMFYRGLDPEHPLHDASDAQARGAIQWIYEEADRVLGETLDRMGPDDKLIVLSDHGFAPFRKAVHLNRWLANEGYLVFESGNSDSEVLFEQVDWKKTQAYALGLNGIFINQLGREPQGVVSLADTQQVKDEISRKLLQATDPDTSDSLVRRVFDRDKVYSGLAISESPDLIVGYEKNYRSSWQTTLGGAPANLLENNNQKWSGDHCIDPALVPGVLLSSFALDRQVQDIQQLPHLVLDLLGDSHHE